MATKTIKAIMKVEDKFSAEFAKLNKGLSEIQKQNEKTNLLKNNMEVEKVEQQ